MKRPGTIVEHEDGRIGRTFNDEKPLNGKVVVHWQTSQHYTEENKDPKYSPTGHLIHPTKFKVTGFID